MKNFFKIIFISAISVLTISGTYAQKSINTKGKVPKWVSEKGFWQIESNLNNPQNSIVYFYNNENLMVNKMLFSGVNLNLNKRKVKMRLKRELDMAIATWNKDQVSQNRRH